MSVLNFPLECQSVLVGSRVGVLGSSNVFIGVSVLVGIWLGELECSEVVVFVVVVVCYSGWGVGWGYLGVLKFPLGVSVWWILGWGVPGCLAKVVCVRAGDWNLSMNCCVVGRY